MTDIPAPMDQFERPDPVLTNKIVTHLKSQGIFDQFRRECMADVDTKPAYQNLRQRVEGSVAAFLKKNPWRPDMNKNQLRDNLRKHIQSGGFLDIGVDRIVDQVVNPKIYTVFLPKVEEVVQNCLGMQNDKPVFEPPPQKILRPQKPQNFQNKHNLAPRAKMSAPFSTRMPFISDIDSLKPPDPTSSPSDGKGPESESLETDDTNNDKYVVDEDDVDNDAEDDEESPPFEPHSESDRLILGVRTDSSDSNSNDSQVVTTTIVDDNLEERIDNNDDDKEESDEKEEDDVKKEEDESNSEDEYVPKTPTINMESNDGSVVEFNSVSEYRQYQTRFDEESFGNVEEEVVSSQWIDVGNDSVKEERSSNEEDSVSSSNKRKLHIDHFDDGSSSSIDKGSTSDEGKQSNCDSLNYKNIKQEEYECEPDTSEVSVNEHENEDSGAERSIDVSDLKLRISDNTHQDRSKSNSSKDSGKSHRHHESHRDGHHSSRSKHKTSEKELREASVSSSHSHKERKDNHKKDEKYDRHKERERKKSESSSSKHADKDSRSGHHSRDKEKSADKKTSVMSDSHKLEKDDMVKERKESKHENKEKPREHHNHDKDERKHDGQDKHSDKRKHHDSTHKHEKDKRDSSKSSKHSRSSSKHSHRSSDKHRSDKEEKHRDSSDRHKSHDKKSEKENKTDPKKKHREHCKTSDKVEGRRSSDRDSNGPGGQSNISSSSKSSSSRSHKETTVETSDKTTSNSDNTVSDDIEVLHDDKTKQDSSNDLRIASPELLENSSIESDFTSSAVNESKEYFENQIIKMESETDIRNMKRKNIVQGNQQNLNQVDADTLERNNKLARTEVPIYNGALHLQESIFDDSISINNQNKSSPASSVHDTSSEKENMELSSNGQCSTDDDIDSGKDSGKIIKFKKPKTANNMYELKKAMQARRLAKRMEKKRIKLQMKNSDEDSTDGSPINDNCKKNEEEFLGFEHSPTEKLSCYDKLIERLNNEIASAKDFGQDNTNLITSWIDLSPDLDEYIETVLKGKVHRKIKVCVPPISEEFYEFDSELNAYILIKTREEFIEQQKELVDSNLNNLNPVMKSQQVCDERKMDGQSQTKANTLSRSSSSENISPVNNVINISKQNTNNLTPNQKLNNLPQPNKEHSPGNSITSDIPSAVVVPKDEVIEKGSSHSVIAPPKAKFSLTFNQMYEEVLKEKAENSIVSTKTVEEIYKAPRTVVKITNHKTSEQVVVKSVQSNIQDKNKGPPVIMRLDSIANGTTPLITKSTGNKQIPLISRISKIKNTSAPDKKTKSQNGIMSPDSTNVFKEVVPDEVSRTLINDVIGIQELPVHIDMCSDSSDQTSPSEEENTSQQYQRKSRRKVEALGLRQRYDSSDLYKPRLQLSSRRLRGNSSPEVASPECMTAKQKRSATSLPTTTPPKRRR